MEGDNADLGTPIKDKKQKDNDESDTDFQADDSSVYPRMHSRVHGKGLD